MGQNIRGSIWPPTPTLRVYHTQILFKINLSPPKQRYSFITCWHVQMREIISPILSVFARFSTPLVVSPDSSSFLFVFGIILQLSLYSKLSAALLFMLLFCWEVTSVLVCSGDCLVFSLIFYRPQLFSFTLASPVWYLSNTRGIQCVWYIFSDRKHIFSIR